MRNGNVLYEVGLAHAVRLPEEVPLFRPDSDRLLIDVATVRVNEYAPDEDVAAARQRAVEALQEAIRAADLERQLAVDKVVSSLDAGGYLLLTEMTNDTLEMPIAAGGIDPHRNAVVSRLLDSMVLVTECDKSGVRAESPVAHRDPS